MATVSASREGGVSDSARGRMTDDAIGFPRQSKLEAVLDERREIWRPNAHVCECVGVSVCVSLDE